MLAATAGAIPCKLEQLHHTDTESFWKLLRKIKGEKRKTLQNQHEKSVNYFKVFLQKQTPEFPVKENLNIKSVLDIESLHEPLGVEEVKCGLKKLKQNKAAEQIAQKLKC